MKLVGTIIVLIATIAILVVVGCYLWKKVGEGSKVNLPVTKKFDDSIRVKFDDKKGTTVFAYTNDKKITVKGEEKNIANGIIAIKGEDGGTYYTRNGDFTWATGMTRDGELIFALDKGRFGIEKLPAEFFGCGGVAHFENGFKVSNPM